MHERFNDSSRAVSYVASGLRSDFPKATLEVILERKGNTSQFFCQPQQLTHVLLDCCRRFPMASVYYDAEKKDGQVAEIHCHCFGEKTPSCCRYNNARSRVLIHVLREEMQESKEAERTETGA